MEAKMRLTTPEEVKFTMEITLDLESWEKLAEQLANSESTMKYPNYNLREAILELVKKAETNFYFRNNEIMK